MPRTIKLTLAYDGTAYAGWQFQPGQITLQETLEGAIAKITGETLRVAASGRTDAGVHALGQVVSFSTDSRLPVDVLQKALNATLPRDIVVLAAAEAPASFHAVRGARSKRYRYVIDNGPIADVFLRAYAWHVRQPLDVALMHSAAQLLLGKHDFRSFQTTGSPRKTAVRTVFELVARRGTADQAQRIEIEVQADGFLYNMVRNIVGALTLVGRGVQPPAWIAEVLAARDRRAAGLTAPPQGLFLVNVVYD